MGGAGDGDTGEDDEEPAPDRTETVADALSERLLDGLADRRQHLRDLAAHEDEGNDRDDCNEGEDQRVLGKALALLVAVHEI
jgi:hypothetical protein